MENFRVHVVVRKTYGAESIPLEVRVPFCDHRLVEYVCLQHTVVAEALRRPGREPAAGRDPRRAAAVGG